MHRWLICTSFSQDQIIPSLSQASGVVAFINPLTLGDGLIPDDSLAIQERKILLLHLYLFWAGLLEPMPWMQEKAIPWNEC